LSRLSHRWRTQRTAIPSMNCRIQVNHRNFERTLHSLVSHWVCLFRRCNAWWRGSSRRRWAFAESFLALLAWNSFVVLDISGFFLVMKRILGLCGRFSSTRLIDHFFEE